MKRLVYLRTYVILKSLWKQRVQIPILNCLPASEFTLQMLSDEEKLASNPASIEHHHSRTVHYYVVISNCRRRRPFLPPTLHTSVGTSSVTCERKMVFLSAPASERKGGNGEYAEGSQGWVGGVQARGLHFSPTTPSIFLSLSPSPSSSPSHCAGQKKMHWLVRRRWTVIALLQEGKRRGVEVEGGGGGGGGETETKNYCLGR